MFKSLLAAAALAIAATPALAQTAPAQAPCQEPERRQFDFWVGEWDVYPTGQDVLVARSTIEKLYGGCAVRENWKPLKGTGGGSLNAWRPDEKGWRQTWLDSSGAWAEFRGGWTGSAIVIQGDWAGTLTRMTYTPGADGTVRQFGETSADKGATWKTSFDLTYRRAR
ncbi:hypothetical protein [Caulobacter sp. NIBR1757]|uniref:hypothetical protein n=1 Tax=Caulobacter sp. NIBR1757 TaxID=3016000 RepID=UPI0022F0662F|nr:hypothetical protein [Caulobacter sp. NIBR1757]WGM38465.1 hypothetical protein AMEJIAPC_01368 [Caulobacter sp. NIBR1757]